MNSCGLGFCAGFLFEWASPTQKQQLQSCFHEVIDYRRIQEDWARMLACVTGTVDQELLLTNEYLAAENRIRRVHIKGRLLLSDAEKATLAEIATLNPLRPNVTLRRCTTHWFRRGLQNCARRLQEETCFQAVIRRRWRTQNLLETHVSVLPPTLCRCRTRLNR